MSTPAAFAASRIDVPAGTDTGRPSIVRLTIWVMLRHSRHEEMRLLLDQRFELTRELLQPRHDRRRARVAEYADGLPCHVVGDLEQRVQVLRGAFAGGDALEDLGRPGGPFATLRALRAALMGEEARRAGDELH